MNWRLMAALAVTFVSIAVCRETGCRWLEARQTEGYSYNDRNNAIRLFGLGVVGLVLAARIFNG